MRLVASPAGHTRIPRYRFGPKPRRRTEFGLLLFGSLLIVALYVIAELGTKSKIPADLGPFLGIVLALALCAHMANRWLVPNANPVILPLAALLNGIGYVVVARWNPPYARSQAGWIAIGLMLYVVTLLVVRYSRDLERYRYLLLLLAGALLVAPLFFSPINGARLWVHAGGFEFQPIEFSKILLCIFFASYFAENKEMLSIPTAQIGNRLVLDPRPLVPILVAWGAAMVVIGLEGDIGFAALLFTLFAASSTDVMANFFHVSLNATLWFFRIAVIVVPIIAGFVTYQLCREMQGVHGIGKRKRAVIVRRSAEGEYTTVPAAPRPDDERTELDPEPVPVRIDIEPLGNGDEVRQPAVSPTGVRQVTR